METQSLTTNSTDWKRERICLLCSSPYTPHHWHQRYCSRECAGEVKKPPPVVRACQTCGVEFNPNGAQRFCSVECRPVQTPTPKPPVIDKRLRTCVQCGQAWRTANPDATYTTCYQCRQAVDLDREYRDPKSWRNAVKKRIPSCSRCGSREELHAHHIVPRSKGGKSTLRNGTTLCRGCHEDHHAGREIPRDAFYAHGNTTTSGTVVYRPHF